LSENRTFIIEEIFQNDEQKYHAAYGTLSTLACAMIAAGYKKVRHSGPIVAPSRVRLLAAFALQAAGLIGASQMAPKLQIPVGYGPAEPSSGPLASADPSTSSSKLQVKCPFDFTPTPDSPVYGLNRVSRHPGLWSFAFLGLGSAAATASVPQALCLAGPVLVAVAGGAHQDSRFRRGLGGSLPPDVDAKTSNVPFLAMVTGAQGEGAFSGLAKELKPLNAAAAVAVAAGFALRRGRGM